MCPEVNDSRTEFCCHKLTSGFKHSMLPTAIFKPLLHLVAAWEARCCTIQAWGRIGVALCGSGDGEGNRLGAVLVAINVC